MRALGFEPKKEEIKKMIADIDKEGSGTISNNTIMCIPPIILLQAVYFNYVAGTSRKGPRYNLDAMSFNVTTILFHLPIEIC